jgi:SNF2 family DNA or RNA helicase
MADRQFESPSPDRAARAAPPVRPPRAVVRDGRAVQEAVETMLAAPEQARQAARHAYEAVRDEIVSGELDTMPVDRLREITQGQVQLIPVKQAGLQTVGQVLTAGTGGLERIPDVDAKAAERIIAAASQTRESVAERTRVRLDPDARTKAQTELLAALRHYERARSAMKGPDLTPLAGELGRYLGPADRAASRLKMLFTFSRQKREEARDALARLSATLQSREVAAARKRLDQARVGKREKTPRSARLWKDYLARPVAYNGLLIEVAELAPEEEASQGFLPADIARKVRELRLDQSHLVASLRGYQAFGAKFALVQERVILGDEMGLGKTMQALAAICHLAAGGATHFLVVCPASVVVNWTRETNQHTKLDICRLHGTAAKREAAVRAWEDKGGVAVTTFEALRSLPDDLNVSIAMMVVDEAHYAKNPNALRTKAVSEWAGRSRRVLFLTGTPMENKVGEFRVLVGHLRPEIAERVGSSSSGSGDNGAFGGDEFRKHIAPVYLRRNQDDVLSELPPRLETPEWVTLEGPALRAYRKAVLAGNFMAMRRAAFDPGTVKGSAKLRRLTEIVEEAADSGRKIVVFSYFRGVLETVTATLDATEVKVVGPLTGDIAPAERQAMVDEFTAARGPAVLVSQIQAGGVGLNIQAASVVIIAEPQLTPSIEEQAVARAHRMGQVRRVDVHRLLCEDSVDQRVLELLEGKREAFDEYARRSDMAKATPDAVDVSDLSQAERAGFGAELRKRIIEAERKRFRTA